MRIGIDGGSFCQSHLTGNYVFSLNLIKSLLDHDKRNFYQVYTFCRLNKDKLNFETLRIKKNASFLEIKIKPGWSRCWLSLAHLIRPNHIFLSLNQAIPLISSKRIFGFIHGLAYLFFPNFYQKSLNRLVNQLNEMIKRAEYIFVSSIKVKEEICNYKIQIEDKIKVIPFGVPFDFLDLKVIQEKDEFFLAVGSEIPIKNFDFIRKSFKIFLQRNKKRSHWSLRFITGNLSRDRIKNLFQKASALLIASYYESFSFPIVEAIASGCPVIALKSAVIPELKKYVFLAEDQEMFVDLMEIVAKKRIKPPRPNRDFFSLFSWDNYVKEILNLYEKKR